ncbi:MAG: FGGY family carbohydrate kinase [Pseudomonadota bacterium]
MAANLLIGIDIGTTSVKAILFDHSGSVVEAFAKPYPTHHLADGHVEQDPQTWLDLVDEALRQLRFGHDLSHLSAIGMTSQVNTHVFVGADGKALTPAIVWQDGRCAAEAAELTERLPEEQRIGWWGEPRPIDASHVLARMLWMSRHKPDIWAKTRWVMLPKDFGIFRMTGALSTDPISNLGLVDTELQYIPELLDHLPGAKERVLRLENMTAVAGKVEIGRKNVPVAVGTMDAWAGMFGTGVPASGNAFYLSGTSEVLGIVSAERIATPGVLTFPAYEDITLHAGPTQSGGASFLWCADLLGKQPAELVRLVEALDFQDPSPLFLPHLQGERAPIWDIKSRGSFFGMDASTGPAQLTRAVFEGVACSAAWLLECLEQSSGTNCTEIHCGGGGFQSDIWNQIRADILGKQLRRATVKDPGALGAAGLASIAAGLQPNIKTAFSNLVQFDKTYRPDGEKRAFYAARLELYKKAYEDARSINHALVSPEQ